MATENMWSALLGPSLIALWHTMQELALSFLDRVAPYSTVLSLLLLMGIVYCFVRIEQIIRATKHEDVPHGGGHGVGGSGSRAVADSPQSRFARVQAHAVRNKIAHEGAAFMLPEREAKRVVGLYEAVFREFKYI